MVKIRHLLNPFILSAEHVGFSGNSEFVREDGTVSMGYWEFLDIQDGEVECTLDSEIDENEIYDNREPFKVMNDKGKLCVVRFIHSKRR